MIPAKLRSNANWLVMFRLNPKDVKTVHDDAVLMESDRWDKLVK